MKTTARFDRKRLRRLRERKGWKPDRAAVELGISQTALKNLEEGRNSPSAETLMRIARVYEVTMDEFFPARGTPVP